MMNDFLDKKMLIVDDEPDLCLMVKNILEGAGYQSVHTAADCHSARLAFTAFSPDAILLDVMLPDGDGFSLFEELTSIRDVPVLFLSARDEDESRLKGLGLGADDYITKPFLPRELVLRLGAVLRRVYKSELKTVKKEEHTLRLGTVTVNWDSGQVWRDTEVFDLTAKEYAILKKLSENMGNIVTIDSLCLAAWGEENFGYDNTLMVHIRRLRKKIEVDPSNPTCLLTVRGLGYKLVADSSSSTPGLAGLRRDESL